MRGWDFDLGLMTRESSFGMCCVRTRDSPGNSSPISAPRPSPSPGPCSASVTAFGGTCWPFRSSLLALPYYRAASEVPEQDALNGLGCAKLPPNGGRDDIHATRA